MIEYERKALQGVPDYRAAELLLTGALRAYETGSVVRLD